MTYRWDLQTIPPQLHPELITLVGKYAAKILALRGISSLQAARAFVFPEHYQPSPATDLPDMDRAVGRILQAQTRQERVVIWGDFDCDGVTSTALLWSALQPLGLDLHYTIPLRSEEGHGLNLKRLQQIAAAGTNLILTVDCGVANHAEIAAAKNLGIDVIVTDHHLLPDPLPEAWAVVNPLRLSPQHPLRLLPGVGVAYKLAEAITTRLHLPQVESLLDLVVIGIVADVAVLQRECRYLVQTGLPILATTQRLGLKLLIEREVQGKAVSPQDVGFRIAPKLNAIGRLDDATLAVELLTTSDQGRAQALIDLFVATNEERKELTEQVFAEASLQVENQDLVTQKAIVLASSGWSQGVVGIAASRLVERYGCPTVLVACQPHKGEGYGSGRSIPSVNIVQALQSVESLLAGYGGHPMAAGLRVSLDNLNALTFALTRELSTRVSLDVLQRDLPIDLVLDLNQIQDPVAELDLIFTQLTQLEPFGHGHPQPVIALLNFRPSRFNPGLSRDGKHLQFKIGSRKLWFWGEGSQHKDLEAAKGLDIAFVMEPSSWGSDPWQGKVKDVRVAGEWQLTAAAAVTLQIEDQRQSPSVDLTGAVFDGKIPPQPSSHLLLKRWPYLPEELQDLLDTVKPHTLVLASQAEDFSQVNLAIAHLVQAWEAGSRDPHQLAASGLPLRVIQTVLKLDLDSVPIGSAVVKLMQEVQAFQRWLDEAELGEILKLCKRLMQAG